MPPRWATADEALAFLQDRPHGGAARWAHEVLLAAEPDLRQRIAGGWGALTLHHPRAGYVAGLFTYPRGARLAWEHGVELHDPEGLLRGDGRRVRWMHLDAPGADLAAAIEAFLAQALALRA